MSQLAHLPGRGVLEIAGADRVALLQGLVSNDVALATPGRAIWAALLTPQGKWLADFFILSESDRLLLDCERAQAAAIAARLARFRLRAQVGIRDLSDELAVAAGWGDGAPAEGIVAPDPRLPAAGFRLLAATLPPATASFADWDRHRLALGLPDGSRDLEPEKTVLLEAGFDELGGISWSKGCYLGQELTARTKYRGLIKRRLVPVAVSGPLPAPGTAVFRDGAEAGVMRSGCSDRGLALLRIEHLSGPLTAGDSHLTATVPDWMQLPQAA
jgi:folate-binding protein YgfZ